jgi:LacI family transcriptional regulator
MRNAQGRPPTLHDVAARANVSKQTISRVINNKGEVSELTRQRVLEAIRELGYHPNSLARSLVTSRTLVIGLALPNIDHPFFPQIARGVEDAASEHGYSVFLCNAAGSPERELQALERLRGHRVAGVISFNSRLTDESIERAVGNAFPVMLINRELPDTRGVVIWPGYERGGYLATRHLVEIGRRRIAYLGLAYDSNVDADKFRGLQAALHEAGLSLAPERVIRTSSRQGMGFHDLAQGGYDALGRAMADGVALDAIFASNDLSAVGALRCMTSSGMRIPEDVAVIGFGGSNVSGIVTPTLSTVSMPLHAMGETAFRALLDRITHEEHAPRLVEVEPALIIRESSAVPRIA